VAENPRVLTKGFTSSQHFKMLTKTVPKKNKVKTFFNGFLQEKVLDQPKMTNSLNWNVLIDSKHFMDEFQEKVFG